MSDFILGVLIATIVTFISTFATFFLDKLKSKSKKIGLFIISCFSSGMAVYYSIKENNKQTKSHAHEIETTDTKLDANINKSVIVLDSLQTIQKRMGGVSNTLTLQLVTQKEMNNTTQMLLEKIKKF